MISEKMRKYLRPTKKFPHVWCPGCGIGTIMGAIVRAIDKLKLDADKIVMVSGIGCTSRMPVYLDFNTLHTTHGRSLAFSTGLKLARPELHIIVVTGDGDACAIGGNHFIHSARRNIEMTMIVVNNSIYGMTGGQVSPTTPYQAYGTTAKLGNIERPFDICDLAIAAGAIYVGRATCYHSTLMEKLVYDALQKDGFSVIEAIAQCPTFFGRLNDFKNVVEMVNWQKANAVPVKKAEKMSSEELEGKFTIGLLHDVDFPEYTDLYRKLMKRAQGGG